MSPRDTLETLVRIRRRAVEDAGGVLAASIDRADEAARATRAAETAIEHETERAIDPAGTDQFVEAFAAWLPGARLRLADARVRQDREEADVGRHRAELAACRTALETIETLIAERAAARDAARARADQTALDDAASRVRHLR